MRPSMLQIAAAFKKYLKTNPLAKRLKINKTLKVTEDGKLGVNTTEDIQEGNSLPVTADAVHETVGKVNEALEEI